MKVISFFICEQALAHFDNSIDVFRYYRTAFAPETLPWTFTFSVFSHLEFELKEKGDHLVKSKIVDPDGGENVPFHYSLSIDQEPFEWVDCRLVQNWNFPKIGKYKLCLEIDGQQAAEYQIKMLKNSTDNKVPVGFQSGINVRPSA